MAAQKLSYFHLHLVSDATGETLSTIARACTARYNMVESVDHNHSGVRSMGEVYQVVRMIEQYPGMVMHTMVNEELIAELENQCQRLCVPCIDVLDPVMSALEGYLGENKQPTIGGQHALNDSYFRRIEAMNFTIAHDDGQNLDDLDQADIIIVGVSRTSKTPTSIYLANRGFKTANVPIVSELPVPEILSRLDSKFVVGLIASPDRISHVREKRAQSMRAEGLENYTDRENIAREVDATRKLCLANDWPIIDVTRRSIEETAVSVLELYRQR